MKSNPDTIKITFIGDIMCEPLLLKAARKENTYDFNHVFENVKEIFNNSDYVIGNLETPLAGEESGFVSSLFSFNAPDEFADAIKRAGIDFVSTANNHCMDRGIDGLIRTIGVLNDAGIANDGTHIVPENDHHPFIANIKGTNVAIIPFTYATNYFDHYKKLPDEGYVNLLHSETSPIYIRKKRTWKSRIKGLLFKPFTQEQAVAIKKKLGLTYNTPRKDDYLNEKEIEPYFNQLKKCVQEAKEKADVVLFYPHVGGQFNIEPGKFTEYTVQKALEYGVDAIIASHAHIVQKAENKNGVPCFYSIGNFSMSPNSVYLLHEHLPDYGLAVHLYVHEGKIEKVTFSIFKIVEVKKEMLTIWPSDLYGQRLKGDEEQKKFYGEIGQICETVTGKTFGNTELSKEYILFDFSRG